METSMEFEKFKKRFSTPQQCLKHLEEIRWGDEGRYCLECGSDEKIFQGPDKIQYKCHSCKKTFRIIAGSLFAFTPMKMLPKWYALIFLQEGNDRSVTDLADTIGVTRKTLYSMCDRIHEARKKPQDVVLTEILEMVHESES